MGTRSWSSDAFKNIVIVVSLVAAGFLVAYRFVLPKIAQRSSYTDGREIYDGARGERIRYAVWDAPEAVPGGVNSPERESRPALSPDGHWLVFAVGAEGLNADLWLAEMVNGEARDARPIAIVNSVADELAPAFGPDALYFASNRGGGEGGFDLYVADFDSGSCGAPRWIETPGLNTSANELDPAPAGAPTLFFASDRDLAGYDLFVAEPQRDAADENGGVTALAPLNTRSDEREPALTADLRTLFFASDRGGDYDLYRSVKEAEAWLPPLALNGINGSGTERGPGPSPDGFALYYEGALPGSSEPAAAGELMRARSLELFRLPPRPVGWLDLLLIIALFLLALVAWLAKTWEQLDVIYRCLLLSILVHLLLMWWFRYLHPEGSPGETVPGTGGDRTFAVQLLNDRAAGGAQRERAGALQVARAEGSAETSLERYEEAFPSDAPGTAAEPEPTQGIERARGVLAAAPVREAGEFTPARPGEELAERTPELHDAPEGFERSAAGAPGLAVVAQSVAVERTAETAGAASAPERAGFETTRVPNSVAAAAAASSAGPVQRVERREASVAELGGGGESYTPSNVAPARQAAQGPSGPDVALPREEFVARGAETTGGPAASSAGAPEASLPAPTAFAPVRDAGRDSRGAPRADEGPRRIDVAPAPRSADTGGAPAPEFRPLATRSDDTPGPARPSAPPRLAETPYRSRFGHEKEIALEQHGGTKETEHAVAQGLAYLARIQTREGYWGSQRDYHEKYHHVLVGKTGLALLAFLGAGHTQQSNTEYSRSAERAIAFLLSIQTEENGHFGDSEAYSHGIATYALAECYALTRDERLRQPIERAIARILSQQIKPGDQRPDRTWGGWSYYYPDGRTFDRWPRVSITSWQVMALESARLGGLSVPEDSLAAARAFLLGSWDGRLGAFRYSHDPERLRSGYPTLPGSTPAALFALSLLGEDIRAAEFEPARRFLLSRAPDGYRFSSSDEFVQGARGNLYFWYYGSLALLRVGGSEWDRWNAAMQTTLLPSQEEDGSWRAIDVYGEYAGDDDSDRSYSTALNVLTLEVYYRYFTPLLEMR